MKTLLKIMRSIGTSLLFLFLTILIVIQIVFTSIRCDSKSLADRIDNESLLYSLIMEDIEDERVKEIALDYVDNYVDYVFHKRSYPSVQTVDFSSLDETNLEYGKSTISSIKDRIDLEYEEVVSLRKMNEKLSNGSIYLIINIGIFLVVIALCLSVASFKKGLSLSTISVAVSSLISFIASFFIVLLDLFASPLMYKFLLSIFNDEFIKNLKTVAIVYFIISDIILLVFYAYKRFKNERIISD